MPAWFVVAMGLATVFVGLIAIIIVIMIMGKIVGAFVKTKPAKASNYQAPKAPAASNAVIADRDKVVVAISAAIAEEIGEDAGAIRIVSLRKI
ncbi:MAG: hypothetical protein E7583_09305 [Ruminococcaceae bacterium]|nr:hypothetical protein [Oscillospiraceae bacterium]